METRQMTPFLRSNCLSYSFLYLKILKTHFHVDPLGPFWSVKYCNFGQKLPIRTAHHTFLESRHPEVTKIYCYALSPEGRQERYKKKNLEKSV